MAHISVTRRMHARANIEVKLNILRTWATHGIPTDPSTGKEEFFPSTLRQFKAWDGSLNTNQLRDQIPHIRRVGTSTLDANQDLKSAALSLMALLKAKAVRFGHSATASQVAKEKADELRKLLHLRNAEVVQQQREIHRLNRHIALLERRLAHK